MKFLAFFEEILFSLEYGSGSGSFSNTGFVETVQCFPSKGKSKCGSAVHGQDLKLPKVPIGIVSCKNKKFR
jgi:hypothetical protein